MKGLKFQHLQSELRGHKHKGSTSLYDFYTGS